MATNKTQNAANSNGGSPQNTGTAAPTGPGTSGNTGGPSTGTAAATKAPKGFRLKVQQMLAGIQAVLPDGSTLPGPRGTTLAKADIVTELTGDLAEFAAVDQQQLALTQARKQLQADEPGMKSYFSTLRNSLIVFFGKNSPELSQFGLSVKVPRTLSPQELVARAAASAQTRALRNTQGPKQKAKKQFKGTVGVAASVTSALPTPSVPPQQPDAGSASPAPAPSAAVAPGSPPGVTSK